MNQFVGKYYKNEQSYDGACFTMGLMAVKVSSNKVLVSLTDLGKEFALIKNPIITESKFENTFSNDETKLIYEKIIPQFKIEQQLIKDVIAKLQREGTQTSKELDPIFKEFKKIIIEFYYDKPEELDDDKKRKIVQQARVATMGRLSELKIVDWKVDSSGISHYSLNQEKVELLGL